jgi:hypothetical protein
VAYEFKNPEGQTACWIQRLEEYNFTLKRRQGWKHNNADALFRQPCQEECNHSHKAEAHADFKQLQAIVAVAAAGYDPGALRMEQLNDQDVGPILEEVETEQRIEWKDIAGYTPTYKNCWAQVYECML